MNRFSDKPKIKGLVKCKLKVSELLSFVIIVKSVIIAMSEPGSSQDFFLSRPAVGAVQVKPDSP